jgi:hypothetical protein
MFTVAVGNIEAFIRVLFMANIDDLRRNLTDPKNQLCGTSWQTSTREDR